MSDNVAGLGLAQGFMQGFQFMEGIEDRKQRRALTEKQEQRADESHGLQMASTEQMMRQRTTEMGRSDEEYAHKKSERQRIDDARLAQAVKAGFESGNPDPEMMQEYADRFDIDWSNYVNPEFGKSVDVLKQTASGQSGYRLNSPEVIGAFNTVYRKEIQKGIGEKVSRDGKEYTIVGKKASALVPGKDGKSVMIGLDVQAKDKDGNVITYKAPVTENRSASDDYVKPIDLDKALEQLAGHDLIYRGVQNSPELQSFFNQKLVRLGAADKDKEADKRFVINGKMVDKDGKVLGDFGNQKEWGSDVIQHPILGPVQVGPGGQFKQFKDPNGGGSGSGSGGGKAPADVQIAEWMVAKGLARDYEDAWSRIKESRTDPTKFVADYVSNEMEMQNLNALRPGDAGYRAPDQIREEAIQAFKYIKEQTRGGAGLSSVQQPAQQPQGMPSGQAPTPQSGAGLQTVQQQSAAPKPQVPPERIQQLQGMLQSASPDQHAAIKQQFIEAFGQLPEGF